MFRRGVTWLTLLAGAVATGAELPRDGLRLWLSEKEGLVVVDGQVTAWRDRSGNQLHATVPDGYRSPQILSGGAVHFSPGRLMSIPGELLSVDARQLTLVAVGRPDSAMGVSLLANRRSQVPLIQLDVDENGMARFIVRDKRSRTLRSVTPARFGKKAVFIGVLGTLQGPECTLRVQWNTHCGPIVKGELVSPLVSETTWLGGLPLGERLYSFHGAIHEVMIYDRALSQEECGEISSYLIAKHGIDPAPAPEPDSFDVLNEARPRAPVSHELTTDVCVVGAGSGGIGAAVAAARHGARVVLVERQARLGGTGTNAYVSGWEPGPGCSIAEEIYNRMRKIPGATGVGTHHPNISKFSMGQWYITVGVPYSASLRRAGVPRDQMSDVPYCPDAFDRVVREMLDETGGVTLLEQTTFFHAETNEDKTRVTSVLVEDEQKQVTRILASVFVDCTGCVYLCRSAGCETMLGIDPRARFNEPAAPEKGSLQLNALSRCYAVRPSDNPHSEPAPAPPLPFPRCAHVTGHKDGIRVINPLPMLPGRALIDLGYDECLRRSETIARSHWHWLQQQPEFHGYELLDIAPMLGIRESYRVVTQYVLRQADLDAGLPKQTHPDIIAVADHPCDIHGAGGHLSAVRTAYGIPYRCLVPDGGWENLLVACRGAGFSKIAASSCRLQRTIIQLGHAAGVAAAMAAQDACPVDQIDIPELVHTLDARSRYPEP